jgi:ABC-type dipeptide/oligopeptide/nickel transport system permease component
VKSYLGSLFLRLAGLAALVFALVALVPGDSRSFLVGAFESAGLDLGARPINPWTLSYMSQHFGAQWPQQILLAFARSLLLATLSAGISLVLFLAFFALLKSRSATAIDLCSGFFLSLVSVLVAPVMAIAYFRWSGSGDSALAAYLCAALSISFVAVGSYLRFAVAKYTQVEVRELSLGLSARGIGENRVRWVHTAKLLLPDFLVLFLSRYAAYISGVFVAELVFNLRGLGWYFSQAFQSRSSLLLLLLVLSSAVLYLAFNHLALWLAGVIDPRRQRDL